MGLVRTSLRWVNVLVALATLGSGLAVLVPDVIEPGYRISDPSQHWLVAAYWAVQLVIAGYCAVQVLMIVQFARDGRLVPWLAGAKAIAASIFLAGFVSIGHEWMFLTPARYVYQLLDFDESKIGLFALVFLGRGAFNFANAFFFTAPWWRPLRVRRPLVGRLVTTAFVASIALSVSAFLGLVREEERWSHEAQSVADLVLYGLDCDTIRARAGERTTDVRQRGDRHYQVQIAYGCDRTDVLVHTEDGRTGRATKTQPACCQTPS